MALHGASTYLAITDAGAALQDLSSNLTNVAWNREQDEHDNTAFGATAHTYQGGLGNGTATLTGWWDKTALTGTHTVMKELVDHKTPVLCEYGPEGDAAGQSKESVTVVVTAYNVSSPVADLVSFTATLRFSGPVTDGVFI